MLYVDRFMVEYAILIEHSCINYKGGLNEEKDAHNYNRNNRDYCVGFSGVVCDVRAFWKGTGVSVSEGSGNGYGKYESNDRSG